MPRIEPIFPTQDTPNLEERITLLETQNESLFRSIELLTQSLQIFTDNSIENTRHTLTTQEQLRILLRRSPLPETITPPPTRPPEPITPLEQEFFQREPQ